LGERAVPGVETFDGRTLRRSIHLPAGATSTFAVTADVATGRVTLDVSGRRDERGAVEVAVRRWLDLDADATAIGVALARDPALRPLATGNPGIRVPGAIDGFELAVRAVLGQQITVRGARTLAGRIVQAAGTPIPEGIDGVTHAFPTPAELAGASLDGLGLTGRRIATLHRLSTLVADGTLDLSGGGDPETTAGTLLAIPGVGSWTVAYIAMRALRDPDAFPATDLGIRRGFGALGLDARPAAIDERAERWRPYRAYAAMLLWTAAAGRAAVHDRAPSGARVR
jgi:AraC family transcriptional regulator, regulatory protein of adaptative response / DNA-3-methyladenine glycosylase II